MQYIDLHVHSNCSDGTCTPEELVQLALDNELVAFALTDHDTVDGVSRAMAAAKDRPISVIPGVELSCEYVVSPEKKKEIHILGYNIDYTMSELLDTLTGVAEERDNRNRKMCENLHDAGFPIDYESLIQRFGSNILTRAHFARFLLEQGAIPSIDSAFKKILAENGPYFVVRRYLTPEEGIRLIKKAGGVPVLAHPLLYKLSVTELHNLITELKGYGLKGIEAMYSRNHGNDEAFVRKLAKDFDLFITGGTDFHGANKPDLEIGRGEGNLRVPVMLLENLK
ncbi:MAG: PHP domain-containing protein [Lachnospiraceae bacterium]|nr:PHP domain-containing protein [Lachnospiraceae bacterium]